MFLALRAKMKRFKVNKLYECVNMCIYEKVVGTPADCDTDVCTMGASLTWGHFPVL